MNEYWIWIDTDGWPVDVRPVSGAGDGYETEDGQWVEGWLPDGPGQRPPQQYQVTWLEWSMGIHGIVRSPSREAEYITIYPLEPWSAYDAITDELHRRGWREQAPTTQGE